MSDGKDYTNQGQRFSTLDYIKLHNLCVEPKDVTVKAMGIGPINPSYILVNDIEDELDEYKKIEKFLIKYSQSINEPNIKIEFLNYGENSLCFLLSNGSKKKVLSVKQPRLKFGSALKEHDLLTTFGGIYDHIIMPSNYYSYGECELFETPYFSNSLSIERESNFGYYRHIPYPRFYPFNSKDEAFLGTSIIAFLVNSYDDKKNLGISGLLIDNGDFILSSDYINGKGNIDNVLNNLYLTSIHNSININFDDYLKLIREEFTVATIGSENSILNKEAKVPMQDMWIKDGIKLGLSLRNKRK